MHGRAYYSRCFEGQDCTPPGGVRGSFGCARFGRRGEAARIRRDSSRAEGHAVSRGPSPGRPRSGYIRARMLRGALNFHAETRIARLMEQPHWYARSRSSRYRSIKAVDRRSTSIDMELTAEEKSGTCRGRIGTNGKVHTCVRCMLLHTQVSGGSDIPMKSGKTTARR